MNITALSECMESIKSVFSALPGKLGFYYGDLNDPSRRISINSEECFTAASVIKVPVLAAVCREISLGKLSLADTVVVREEVKVPGCGCYSLMPGDITTTVEALISTMIAISDNTATNVLINLLGLERIHETFTYLGLVHTQLQRRLYDSSAVGKRNIIRLDEIASLFKRMYRGELISLEMDPLMINKLLLQQINHKIPSKLPYDTSIAHKTGEVNGVSHDIGLVLIERPYVIGFASEDTDVPGFEQAIRDISLTVYQYHTSDA